MGGWLSAVPLLSRLLLVRALGAGHSIHSDDERWVAKNPPCGVIIQMSTPQNDTPWGILFDAPRGILFGHPKLECWGGCIIRANYYIIREILSHSKRPLP